MKKPVAMHPDAAFPDEKRKPGESELSGALGSAFAPWSAVVAPCCTAHPDITPEWRFSPQSGWYLIYHRRARRIFYFIPRRGDFQLTVLLGDKAIAALRDGPNGRRLPALLKTAKRYPEGTAFSFTRENLDIELTTALLEAKIAH